MSLGITFYAGNRVTASQLQAMVDQIDVLSLPDLCIATRVANQSYTNGLEAALSLDTQEVDTAAMFGPTDTKIYAATAGVHIATGNINIASPGASGMFILQIRHNGTTIAAIDIPLNSNGTARASISVELSMAVSEYVELYLYNGTGGTRNVTGRLGLCRQGPTS